MVSLEQRKEWLDRIVSELRNPIEYEHTINVLREPDLPDGTKRVCALGLIADVVDPEGWEITATDPWVYLGVDLGTEDNDWLTYTHHGLNDSLDRNKFKDLLGIDFDTITIPHTVDDCGVDSFCIVCGIEYGYDSCSQECSAYLNFIHDNDEFESEEDDEEDLCESREPDCTCLEEFECTCDCDSCDLTTLSDDLGLSGWSLIADAIATRI